MLISQGTKATELDVDKYGFFGGCFEICRWIVEFSSILTIAFQGVISGLQPFMFQWEELILMSYVEKMNTSFVHWRPEIVSYLQSKFSIELVCNFFDR